MREAIVSDTKEPICVLVEGSNPSIICPDCSNPVYFRQRVGWTDHFCHKPNSLCTTKIATNPESLQHEIGKVLLKERLAQSRPDLQVRIERSLPGNSRRADVAAFRDGKIVAVYECQVSPILVRGKTGLEQRTKDYFDAGISVTWWFGERSLTATIRHWCETFFGDGTWEVIEHPQVRLEGYLLKQQGKKVMNNFLGNAIVDCVGLDKLDELIKEKLLEAIGQGDADTVLKISTTWSEVQKTNSHKQQSDAFRSDKHWGSIRNQILYILWQSKESLSEPLITKKAIDLFEFPEILWTDLVVVLDNHRKQIKINEKPGRYDIRCWDWIVGYSFCLSALLDEGLICLESEYNYLTNEDELCYRLTPTGQELTQEIVRDKVDSLCLKDSSSATEELHLLTAAKEDKQKNEPAFLPREYTERFTLQVLLLFSQSESMTRKELYRMAQETYSFTEEDCEVMGVGKSPLFPKWKEAYSRNVDNLMRHELLEYASTNNGIKKNKALQITQAGREKLASLNSTKKLLNDTIQPELSMN
jgi:hypothetical protein